MRGPREAPRGRVRPVAFGRASEADSQEVCRSIRQNTRARTRTCARYPDANHFGGRVVVYEGRMRIPGLSRRWLIAGAISLGLMLSVTVGLAVVYPRVGAWMIRTKVGSKLATKLGREIKMG